MTECKNVTDRLRRFKKADGMVARRVRGEHILVPIAGHEGQLDSLYTLNATGSLVWERAVEGMSEAEICRVLAGEYAVDEPGARRDVARVLDELLAIGALERVDV
jgi:hypothetical protein